MLPPMLQKAEGASVTFCPCLQLRGQPQEHALGFPAQAEILATVSFQQPLLLPLHSTKHKLNYLKHDLLPF